MTLHELSFFYNNFSIMLNSGIGLIQFFESTQKAERDPHRKNQYAYIILELKKGHPLYASLKRIDLLPVFDIPVIESGEKSGKLPHVLQILSKNYQQSADAEKHVKAGLVKPFFMFFVALFVPKFPELFTEKITLKQYLVTNFSVIIVVLLIFYSINRLFMRSYFDVEIARLRHKAFLYIPFLRTLTQRMALEKFASSLALMLEAGLPILEALSLAGQTSPEREINLACRRIIAEIKSGRSMVNAFRVESIFTEDIVNSVSLGYESGNLPTFLQRSADLLKTQVTASIEKISKALPVIIYYFVVLYSAWTILKIYLDSAKELGSMLGGF